MKLSRWEGRFKTTWFAKPKLPARVTTEFVKVGPLDYESTMLLHLSILWRASAAAHGLFNQVNLGPWEDRIRAYLLRGIAPEPAFVPLFAIVLFDSDTGEVQDRLVMPHTRNKIEGVPTYCAVFGGCAWYYPVAKHHSPFDDEIVLTRAGTMYMPVMPISQFQPLLSYVASYRRAKEARSRGTA